MSTLSNIDDDNRTERTVAAGAFIFSVTLDFCLRAPPWQAVAHLQDADGLPPSSSQGHRAAAEDCFVSEHWR